MGEIFAGGCLCGAIRYEATRPPDLSGTCNCRRCQQWSGSSYFAFAGFPRAAFRFTTGEPKYYRSAILERAFCPTCGSGIANRYLFEKWAGRIFVGLGTLDAPEAVKLDFHFGVESRLPWVHFDDGLHRARCDEDADLAEAWAAAEATGGS